jgi:arylsulfatase A-like enzyme
MALGGNLLLRKSDYERFADLGIDDALEMLRSLNPDGGDFVYIHLYDPHAPYTPPKRFLPQDDYTGPYAESSGDFLSHADELTDADVARLKELYEAEVRLVDERLGRALDVLDDRGLWENTVFIFLADHGEEFREHGLVEHFHINLQPELTHIPLVVYWPGRLEGGGKFIQPVALADVYATILDGLGIDNDEKTLNGRSLLKPLPEARPVFAQRCMDEDGTSAHSDFVVRDKTALFMNYDDDVEELYVDYYQNPENVAGDNPETVAELKELLTGWHERNAELMRHYGTGGDAGPMDAEHLEQLRAVGYIQ